MTEPYIPAHAQTLRLAAAQETARATQWATHETDLAQRYTRHQAWADEQRNRVRAELEEARNKAQRQFDEIDETGKTLAADLAEAARRKDQHAADGKDAQTSWLEWCTRNGVDPDALPPVRPADTGPLPVIPAAATPITSPSGEVMPDSADSGPWTVPHDLLAQATAGHPVAGEPVAGPAATTTATDLPAGAAPFPGPPAPLVAGTRPPHPDGGGPLATVTDATQTRTDQDGDA